MEGNQKVFLGGMYTQHAVFKPANGILETHLVGLSVGRGNSYATEPEYAASTAPRSQQVLHDGPVFLLQGHHGCK